MVELTLILAILNISLGFALAIGLGYGPPNLLDSLGTIGRFRPRISFRRGRRAPPPPPPPTPNPPGPVILPTSAALDAMLDVEDPEEVNIEPFEEPYDDDIAELMSPGLPEQWDLNEKYVETSILQLNIAMIKSGMRATEIDTRLRKCRGRTDRETVETCVRLLREDCISYLAEQSEAAEKFSARISELGELSSLGQEIEMSNLEQSAQVETTINNLDYMDFHGDLELANQRLIEELKNLRMARHRLNDNQESAFLAIARYENRIDKMVPQLFIDPLTKLRNRIGLESMLNEWWSQGRNKSRAISAVLYDLDKFGIVNEFHGPLLGDKILYEVGRLIQSSVGKADLVGRFAGERFLVMMLDVGPRAALKSIELLRQSLEKVTFRHADEKINITMAGIVTEVTPDDSYPQVLERLEQGIKQVKKAGPNQTFLHNGRQTEPIESPSFGAVEREIMLAF